MDAQELMEWVAFSYLSNDENKAKIERLIAEESSTEEKAQTMRNFLNQLKPTKQPTIIRKPLAHGSKR